MDTIQHTRRVRLAALVGRYDGVRSDDLVGPDDRDVDPDNLPATIAEGFTEAFALIESNQRGSDPAYWLTLWATADAAADYHVSQEYASDWLAEDLVDLDTGTAFVIETRGRAIAADVDAHPIPAEAVALDRIAEVLRDADWSDVMYDGDALGTIAELVALTGRTTGPDDGSTDDDAEGEDDADRDRANDPRYGDQTACKWCGLDVEYHGPEGGWIDRGGNRSCGIADPVDGTHEPVSDAA